MRVHQMLAVVHERLQQEWQDEGQFVTEEDLGRLQRCVSAVCQELESQLEEEE